MSAEQAAGDPGFLHRDGAARTAGSAGAPRRTSRAGPAPTAWRGSGGRWRCAVRKRSIMADPVAVLCALLCQGMHNPRRGIKDRQAGAGWLRSILELAGSNSAWTRRRRDWIGGGSRSSRSRPDRRRCCLRRRSRRSGPRGRSPDCSTASWRCPAPRRRRSTSATAPRPGASRTQPTRGCSAAAASRRSCSRPTCGRWRRAGCPSTSSSPSTTRSARPAGPCSST